MHTTNSILFISNNNLTDSGLSGGDRILIELLKNWQKKAAVSFLGAGEGINLLKKYQATKNINIYTSAKLKQSHNLFSNFNYLFHTLNRTFWGIVSLIKYRHQLRSITHLCSASDFYPDTIPAFILKLLHPDKIWIASFYLFAPAPWQSDNPYRSSFPRFITGILYWLTQRFSFWLVYYFADYVMVTSQPDVTKFASSKRPTNKIIVVQGGVDTTPSRVYLSHPKMFLPKKYLAVFIGRLHPQKGVLELIDIWKLVCQKIPTAKLAIIGNGPLESQVKTKITKLGLKNNIDLLGFLDGPKKFTIFKQSLMVVHPATYDSGGMAAAEAMAWGLPGVSFDLESLKTYYPQGMLKAKCFNNQEFTDNIIRLSQNPKLYQEISSQAVSLIKYCWSWSVRAKFIYHQIFS